MAYEATVNVVVTLADGAEIKRIIAAAVAHVARAKEKHGMATPDDCYEPTMAELWRSLIDGATKTEDRIAAAVR